ncbi:hypothetical protein [Pseudolactococcus yaeyamensis]
MINALGFLANITSLILWFPQATKTWQHRHDKEVLKGVSLGTQIFVIINTLSWCIYGLLIGNFWLPLGTIVILPLAVFTIMIKLKSSRGD